VSLRHRTGTPNSLSAKSMRACMNVGDIQRLFSYFSVAPAFSIIEANTLPQ
jgi:hypothetical protein